MCALGTQDTEPQHSVLQSHACRPLLDERNSSPCFTLPVRHSILTGSRIIGNVTDWGNRSRGDQVTKPVRVVQKRAEAPGGFEPPNRGFADRCLRPLGYGALHLPVDSITLPYLSALPLRRYGAFSALWALTNRLPPNGPTAIAHVRINQVRPTPYPTSREQAPFVSVTPPCVGCSTHCS